MSLRQPFELSGLKLSSNIFCAPMAGCTDLPFRQIVKPFQPGLIFCEMVKTDALIRCRPKTFRYLDYTPDMHPIGAQIVGSNPTIAAQAAVMIEDLGFDLIDFNCGCPVDKVVKDGSGSGLLKQPERIGEILSALVNAVDIPVTIKIRSGWDQDHLNAVQITQIAEQAGASAITVHGRTRVQAYKGLSDWNIIKECKKAAKNILVIGNGDVFDAFSAARMFAETHCDGILLARGTLGQPWLVEDIYRHLAHQPPIQRTIQDVRNTLTEHFQKIVQYQSPRQALFDMRRVGCWYLKRCIGAKALRIQINQAQGVEEVWKALDDFDWESLRLHDQPIEVV